MNFGKTDSEKNKIKFLYIPLRIFFLQPLQAYTKK